ncbi:MAG: hypothetical protein LW852_06215 [Sediminibacterium sp.]|jgi:hypothetical protein|nr:hypothetical protein [Sediminibacterium sp.]
MTLPFQPIDPDFLRAAADDTTEIDPDFLAAAASPSPVKKNTLFDRGVSAAVAGGGDIAANVFGGLGKVAEGLGKERSFFSDISDRFRETANKHRANLASDPANTFGEKSAEFVGTVLPSAVVGGALAKTIFNPITSSLARTKFANTAAKISQLASSNRTVQKGIAAGITSLPAEIAGSYATTALTTPEDAGGMVPLAGAGIGAALNSIMGARAFSQAAKQYKLNSLNADMVPPDPMNVAFEQAVTGARQTAKDAAKLFRSGFIGTKKNPVSNSAIVPTELKKSYSNVNKILRSLEVDGPTVTNVSALEAEQQKLIDLADNMYNLHRGAITTEQFDKLLDSVTKIEGIKLPQYNWASPTPTVSALQRLQDNIDFEGPIRLDPNAKLGTVEALVAGERPKSPSAYSSIAGWFQKTREQYVNYKGALKIFGSGEARDPYDMSLLLSGNNGRVYQNLEVQPKLLDKKTGEWVNAKIDGKDVKSMKAILEMSGTDDASLAKLNGYVIAKQLANSADPNVRASVKLTIPGFTPEWGQKEMERIMREAPDIAAAGEEFFLRSKMMAEYMRDLVGDEVADEWMKIDYAPAARALQGRGDPFGFRIGRTGGSELVFNPVVKHIENTQIAIAATEKTRMWQRLHDVISADKDKYASSARIVETNQKILQRTLDAVKKANPDMNEVAARKVANLIASTSVDKSSKTVSYLKDGKMSTIQFGDDFMEMFNGFEGPAELGFFGQIGQKLESVPRTLFSLVNDMTLLGPMRDMAEVYVNDPNVKPGLKGAVSLFVDTIKGLKEVHNEGELYQRVLSAGGGIGGRYVGPTGGFAATSFEEMKRRAANEMPSVLRKLEEISASLSQASRMGAAMRVFEKGGSDSEAARIFRAVIADPQQIGSKMQSAARITAFMNMGIQSADKFATQVRNNPELVAMKGLAGIGIPAATLWYYGKDDAEIQQLRGSKGGENYFYVRFGEENPVIRIPKPYLYGQVFGTGVETVLDKMFGNNPQAVEQLMQGIWGQTAVNILPLSTQALVNTTLGQKYLGLGEGLIPSGGATNNQMAGDQRFQNTTTLARTLGDKTGIPAANWDDIMRTFLTNEPFKAVAYADRKLTDRTAPTSEDVPVMGKFLPTQDKSNIGSVNRFYDMANKYSDVLNSLNDAENKGDVGRVENIINNRKNDLEQAMVFSEGLKEVQEMRSAINLVNENKMMTPEERRSLINELNKAIREYTVLFLDAWDTKKKQK